MVVHTLTLNVPDVLYTSLKRRAERTNRSVEAELLDVLAGAVPVADELPADLAAAVSPLAVLDDAALERAARARLPEEAAALLEALTDAEAATLAGLVRQYERGLLVRAQAVLLLSQRGHDVSHLRGAG